MLTACQLSKVHYDQEAAHDNGKPRTDFIIVNVTGL